MLPIASLFRRAKSNPRAAALVADGRETGFANLARRIEALAAAFVSLDDTPGSRIAVLGDATTECLLAWLAALAAGKTWVPLNTGDGNERIAAAIEATAPSVIVADGDGIDRLAPGRAKVILGRESGKLHDVTLAELIDRYAGAATPHPVAQPDSIQAILFTGGSGGTPKPVPHTVRMWNTAIAQTVVAFDIGHDERLLLATPLAHGTGAFVLPVLAQGGAVVVPDDLSPKCLLEAMERHRVTIAAVPPATVTAMLAVPGAMGRDLTSLRHLVVTGGALRGHTLEAAQPVFNHAVEAAYALAEIAGPALALRVADRRDRRDWVATGRPPATLGVEAIGPDGRALGPGETGEIAVAGDAVAAGYFNMPKDSAKAFRDGWFRTGDAGFVDERGIVFVRGPIRDSFEIGGLTVHPAEIEAGLGLHPAVKECVAFAVEGGRWGPHAEAAVEFHPGMTAEEKALIGFAHAKLDTARTPHRVHVMDRLPRDAAGRISRRLAAEAAKSAR